ncbi:MFS transporter, partial [Streptomyces galilaeus]|uniref:MFS transporter n=1 Tax=Streptomyces galilaeus TaxID=33899 RepID=UPI0038F79F35
IGAAAGAALAVVLLDPAHFSADVGWRLAFGLGAILSSVILFMRLWIPESPRWLVTHGRSPEADRVMDDLESRFLRDGHMLASGPFPSVRLA